MVNERTLVYIVLKMIFLNDVGKIVGRNIKKLRTNRGMSVEALAIASEISTFQLNKIEKGGNPTVNTLEKISKSLSIRVSMLFELEDGDMDLNDKSIEFFRDYLKSLDQTTSKLVHSFMHDIIKLTDNKNDLLNN